MVIRPNRRLRVQEQSEEKRVKVYPRVCHPRCSDWFKMVSAGAVDRKPWKERRRKEVLSREDNTHTQMKKK